MSLLIVIEKIIKMAKKQGIDLGKGDPYNRLRYYTKIGWLPHMIRKKAKDGEVKGHYPKWAFERLMLLDKLKKQGLNNEQIENKINTRNKLQNLYEKVNASDFKNKIILYITLFTVVIILLNELDIINISKSKNKTLITQTSIVPNQIVDSGSSFVPAGKNNVFIKNQNILMGSRVYITFNQNFSPATRYWVSKIDPQKGFYVELDAPTFDNVEFSWWIS